MSRIGRLPIPVPAGVTVTIADDNTVTLTVEDGKITDAVVTGEKETPGFGYEPIYEGTYAKMIVDAFLTNEFEGGRHQARVDDLNALDADK